MCALIARNRGWSLGCMASRLHARKTIHLSIHSLPPAHHRDVCVEIKNKAMLRWRTLEVVKDMRAAVADHENEARIGEQMRQQRGEQHSGWLLHA